MSKNKKTACKFGAKCYRKNPSHFEHYSHPDKSSRDEETSSQNCPPAKRLKLQNDKKISKNLKEKKNQVQMTPLPLMFGKKVEKTKSPNEGCKSPTKLRNENKKENILEKTDNNVYSSTYKDDKESSVKKKIEKINNETDKNNSTDSIEENSNDSSTVQSTSWVFIKKSPENTAQDALKKSLKDKSKSEVIKILFLVDMPNDFYSFYEFCKSIDESSPLTALQFCEIKLVGPFDVLSGIINDLPESSALCHWRFYYDPPEFQTVIATKTEFHMGYWRDDPKDDPVFVASNDPSKNCIFKIESENIFGAVLNYLENFIKTCNPFLKMKASKLQTALKEWAGKNDISVEGKSSKMTARQKKVVSKTFHEAGIVVPVETKTEIGYRPLIETAANLKKICKLIADADDESERESLWENLQPLITAANIANDECDFGNSLELGIDLFCMGSPVFHETAEYLLTTAYSLLNRSEFAEITKVHLQNRRKGNDLSVF